YYLSMASVYDEWIGKITNLREEMREYEIMAAQAQRGKELEEDKILAELQYIKRRISTSSSILTDKEKTAFFFVVIPEQMVLLDTVKAAGMFARFNVPISGYIINRVIPADVACSPSAPAYLTNRYTMQQGYLKQIDQQFGRQVLARIPEFERDVTGLEM